MLSTQHPVPSTISLLQHIFFEDRPTSQPTSQPTNQKTNLKKLRLAKQNRSLKIELSKKQPCLYAKVVYLKHDHNAANKKGIRVQTTEKTSKNHLNMCNQTIQPKLDSFLVGFGRITRYTLPYHLTHYCAQLLFRTASSTAQSQNCWFQSK